MRHRLATLVLVVVSGTLLAVLVGCGSDAATVDNDAEIAYTTEEAPAMSVESSAFDDGAPMPAKYAREGAGGDNVSIPFEWSDPPAETKSYAVVLMDLHPVAHRWVHWMVVDIPASVSSVGEGASGGAMPAGSRELPNTWGEVGYGGPEPPVDTGGHEYRITVYALDVEVLDIADDGDLRDFLAATEDHILAEASYSGVFDR